MIDQAQDIEDAQDESVPDQGVVEEEDQREKLPFSTHSELDEDCDVSDDNQDTHTNQVPFISAESDKANIPAI